MDIPYNQLTQVHIKNDHKDGVMCVCVSGSTEVSGLKRNSGNYLLNF